MSSLDDSTPPASLGVAEIRSDLDLGGDELNPADRRQAAVVALGRRAIAPPDVSLLMQDAATLLAETIGTEFGGVAKLIQDDQSLEMRLLPAEGCPGRQDTVTQILSSEKNLSMVGYALSVAHPIFVNDLSSEQRFSDALLKRHGIRSGIVCPLMVANRSFGALGVFSSKNRTFDKEDILFAETIAHLVTTAAARQRAETDLEEQNSFTDAVLETVDALVLVLDKNGKILHFNRACQNVTGFTPAEVRDRAIWSAFLVPEEVSLVRGAFEQLRSGKKLVEYETFLLTKHGVRLRIAWSYTVENDPDGSIRTIIATGIDVTLQRQAEEQLQKTEKQAAETRQTLEELMERIDNKDLDLLGLSDVDLTQEQPGSVVATKLPRDLEADRRDRARRAYPYQQRVAAVIDGKLPSQSQFEVVQCRDISAGGFSYLSPTKPTCEAIVVAFGVPPSLTFLAADILHSRPTDRGGQKMFVVGCRYTGRIIYSNSSGSPKRVD